MSDFVKTFLSIVLITSVLVLVLKDAQKTSDVMNAFSGGVTNTIKTLQGR